MNFSKAHFIGIAGKGMSATALLLRQIGVQITGSDEGFYPPVSDYLKSEKIRFAEGYRKENIPDDADVIVIGKNAKLIPDLIDQNPCAHWRNPMDMIFQGRSTRVFQA